MPQLSTWIHGQVCGSTVGRGFSLNGASNPIDQISKQKVMILKFSCGKRLSGEGYRSHGEKVACSELLLLE